MNRLKYIAIAAIVALYSSSAIAQDKEDNDLTAYDKERNYLTSEEFGNIKINGIRFDDIDETKGDIDKVKALFGYGGLPPYIRTNDGTFGEKSIRIEYLQKGFWLYFVDYAISSEDNDYHLDGFEIKNSDSNITIKGKTVTIGDSIEKLGKVNIRYSSYSDVYLIIFKVKIASSSLHIYFNPKTKKITKIKYFTPT